MGFGKRHPERTARRRCFDCKAEICNECQVHLDSHIFCSHQCHLHWQAGEKKARRKKRLTAFLNAFNPAIWWRYPAFRRTDWAKRSMLMVWLLLITNLATVAALFAVTFKVRDLAAVLESNQPSPTSWPPTWLSDPQELNGQAQMRVAARSHDTYVLKNGRPVAKVAAGTVTAISVRSDSQEASVWQLAHATSLDQQRWTVPEPSSLDLRRGLQGPGIALTFDGGADRNAVDFILATLQRHQVRATFFLTGDFIARYPQDTRRIVAYGHEIGNHTWSHLHLTTFNENFRHNTLYDVSKEQLQIELLKTAHVFGRVTGKMMAPFWRAPYGETNDEINSWAHELGFQHIGWTAQGRNTMDTLDWVADPSDPLYVSGAAMAERIVALAQRPEFQGGIVLMHVGTQRKSDLVQAHLPDMITGIAAAGIPLLTVSELSGKGS